MSATPISLSMRKFIDYFGELGPRWGLDANACRVHAYLYLIARPANEESIGSALDIAAETVSDALAYLLEFRMIAKAETVGWQAGNDPWEMLFAGLEERRRRELEPALSALRHCHTEAARDEATSRSVQRRMGDVLGLVEDLAAVDLQARRVSPQFLRQLIGVSGRAARFIDRTLGGRKERQ